MRSPIEVTYDEVVANPYVCESNPMGRRPYYDGSVLLWEGREDPKNLSSSEYRVVMEKNRKLHFYKLNKRFDEWVEIPALEPRRRWFRKAENPPPGVIRIEVFADGRTKRTPKW